MRVIYRRGGGGGTENDWCLCSGRQSVDDSTIPNRGIVWGQSSRYGIGAEARGLVERILMDKGSRRFESD